MTSWDGGSGKNRGTGLNNKGRVKIHYGSSKEMPLLGKPRFSMKRILNQEYGGTLDIMAGAASSLSEQEMQECTR